MNMPLFNADIHSHKHTHTSPIWYVYKQHTNDEPTVKEREKDARLHSCALNTKQAHLYESVCGSVYVWIAVGVDVLVLLYRTDGGGTIFVCVCTCVLVSLSVCVCLWLKEKRITRLSVGGAYTKHMTESVEFVYRPDSVRYIHCCWRHATLSSVYKCCFSRFSFFSFRRYFVFDVFL